MTGLTFDIPFDLESTQAAIAQVVKNCRWSHTCSSDDAIPGACEWRLLDLLTGETVGTVGLRKLGDGVRLAVPAIPRFANTLVPGLQALGVPLKPREQLVALGTGRRVPPGEQAGRAWTAGADRTRSGAYRPLEQRRTLCPIRHGV